VTTARAAIDDFVARLDFEPDRFQREAFEIIADGESVLVTAPTSAGKTLVAEAAVAATVATGKRAFYTTPIKALSNQKYADFSAQYGADNTGLLTGDNSINSDAPVIVMTTEVLRNMIYTDSHALVGLGVVVMDEIHYLQDPARGPVWEEIIIHLPLEIPLVGLSATVANAEEFTAWINSRRGSTHLVLEENRPVPLTSLYLIHDGNTGEKLMPVFRTNNGRRTLNSKVVRLLSQGGGRRRRFHTPRRTPTVEVLKEHDLLPAIYFIFSRAGCGAAAEQVASDLRLTTDAESAEIRRRAEARTSHLSEDDLTMLGFGSWLSQLERGTAPHHAGMVPAFKEVVEELFSDGLVKVVFATETLALGINMPARSVVIESLSKFNGETHELLQPGDYTQLTGRAGRRGIDTEGVALVLHSPYVPFERVAAIAGAGAHPLRSSFRPTYNMAVNLIANYPRHQAEDLLRASFAQFQREAEMGSLRSTIERNQEALSEYRTKARCEKGDVFEFLGRLDAGQVVMPSARDVMRRFAGETNPGDIIEVPGAGGPERFVLLARGRTKQPRMQLLSSDGRLRRIRVEELPVGATRLGAIKLPKPFRPNEEAFRRRVLEALVGFEPSSKPERAIVDTGDQLGECPDLHDHIRWARKARKLQKELRRQEKKLDRLGGGLIRELQATLELLGEWGYVRGWSLTDEGQRLRTIYSQLDLLLCAAASRGLLDDLDAAQLAAFVSLFVYEARAESETVTWPDPLVAARGEELLSLWRNLEERERSAKLALTRMPDNGFAGFAFGWARGLSLEELFAEDELAAGDFVRTARQLLDVLRQVRDTYPHLSVVAREAITEIDRGVVSAGGIA
jgi:ATP-dependent RNA helicase HelY